MENNLSQCMGYLEKMPYAIAGSGGDKATLRAAMACRRFSLSDGDMWRAMVWFNDNRCKPKWSDKDLRHKMSGLQGVAVTRPLGQKHYQPARRVRAFVAPAPIETPPADTRPIVERSEAEEELWFAQWCVDNDTTLEEFDKAVGNA